MTQPDPATSSPDPHLADVIARAERGRGMLERLAEIGMALAEEIGARTANSPYHPEPRHEPGRAFSGVSRAVRLTVALIARIDADILAMRKGEAPPLPTVRDFGTASSPSATAPGEPAVEFVTQEPLCPRRAEVRGAVWEVIDREVDDVDEALFALDRVHERLIEGEDYDALIKLPFRDCVEAICADLGLRPDWSDGSNDAGFAAREGPKHDWPRLWRYDPGEAEGRRRSREERPPSPEGEGSDDSRRPARAGWGEGAASAAALERGAEDDPRRAHPLPGSRPDAASPPSPLRGREDNARG